MADPPSPTGGETVPPGALTDLLRELAQAPEEPGPAWETGLRPGAVIDRFELLRELGRGGFGVVWEARDRKLGRDVAFKAVLPGGRTALREARLMEEAEAAARLSHPNIVAIHDVGKAEAGPYLVLELLHGQTLARRLAGERLPVAEAVAIAREISKGLAHAHARAVVHRDLKPDNVFLCDDGQVKVLDFGMAQAFGRRKVEGGTSGYMAPEQRRGAPEDERTDVYALGVMLHRMLAGALPFPLDDERTDPPVPRLDVPGSASLGPLVERMLSWEPANRPRDGGAVAAALQAAERELALGPPGSELPRLVPPARTVSRRRVAVVAAALAIAAAAGAIWQTTRPKPSPVAAAPEQPSIAVMAFADMSPNHDQEYLADGVAEEILNALSRIEGLKVIGRTSSFFFKGKSVALPEIARQLGVTSLLEGSVRREGNRIRVTAQLVRAADGVRMWATTHEREFGNVFAIQDEIARAVARSLSARLGKGTLEPAAATPAAYDQYLFARSLANRAYDEDDWVRTRAAYEKVLTLDPLYAPAWSALSTIWGVFDVNVARTAAGREQARRRGLEAAERAIALAPEYAPAYTARAVLRTTVWDLVGAKSDADRALALSPSCVSCLRRAAYVARGGGDLGEAVRLGRMAVELDTFAWLPWRYLADTLLVAGDLKAARQAVNRALELLPGDGSTTWVRAQLDLIEGRYDSVADWAAVQDPGTRAAFMAMLEHSRKRPAESAAAAAAALADPEAPNRPFQLAQMQAWRGRADDAFAWLERALAHGEPDNLPLALCDPFLRPLHSDPRWKEFLRKLNLPVE